MISQICSSELRLLGGTARRAFKSSLIHSLKDSRVSGPETPAEATVIGVVLGGDERDVSRLGGLSITNESGMEALALEVTRDFVEEAGDVCRVVVECDGITG